MKKRVTLDDIAAAVDASPATVSLALRNRPGVSRQRRAEILEAANRLGYVARQREARPGTTLMRNVALIFRTPAWTAERSAPALNHFYSWVLTGIQDGATRHHLNLNLGTIPVSVGNEATTLPRMLASQPLDGLLLVGAFHEETVRAVMDEVGGDRLPVVLVDNDTPALAVDSVTSNHRDGMAEATRHLIDSGHREIGFAGLPPGIDANFDLRRAGYEDAMHAHTLATRYIDAGLEGDDLQAALVAACGELTALACANDHTATLFAHAARRAGIDVPFDLSLIGFDDTVEARHVHPTISTMAVDKPGMGRLAVQILNYRMEWPEAAPVHLTLDARLVERESVRELRADGAVVRDRAVTAQASAG